MTDPLDPIPNPNPASTVPPISPGATAETAYADPTKDDKTMALLAHLLGILSIFGPLIIWLIKKDQSRFVDVHGKEALNFQITLLIVYLVLGVGGCVTFGLTMMLLPVVWVVSLIFSILAAVQANEGKMYAYPVNIRFIK